MTSQLRDRLIEGDRRIVGAAGAVADQVRQEPALLPDLISLLDDDDVAVVAHTAHALMQIAMDDSALFDPHVDHLLECLQNPSQWEIGEQLPKILVRVSLTDGQVKRLAGILAANTNSKSNIVAACSLQGIVDLACDHRIESELAERVLADALNSERKALSARARHLQNSISGLRD